MGRGYRASAPLQKVLVDSGQTPPLHFSPPAFLPPSEATETEIVNDKIGNYLPVPQIQWLLFRSHLTLTKWH